MFPKQRQRVVITLVFFAGALVLYLAYPHLSVWNSSAGLVLLHGTTGAALAAIMRLIVSLLPVAALAVLAASTGNPLSGPFVFAAALTTLAWRSGAIDGWVYSAAVPNSYGLLMGDCVIWLVLLIGMLAATAYSRAALLRRWPRLEDPAHLGRHIHLGRIDTQSLSAGLVCLLVGGALALLLIRNSDHNQVIDGLIVAFLLGGLAGQLVFPQNNPVPMLLSPLVAGLVVYGWVLATYTGAGGSIGGLAATDFLRAWYLGHLPGLALALPIDLASAGVAGCALGIGWAQGLQQAPELALRDWHGSKAGA